MPINQRVLDFEAYIRGVGAPISGLSVSGDPPDGVTVEFLAEATPEQVAWVANAKDTFDWRSRRLLERNQIVALLSDLTVAQRQALLAHMLAAYFRSNKSEAINVLATLGVALPIDEVDPT